MKTYPRILALTALTLTALQAYGQSADLDIIDTSNIVLTPTRLRQPISEVPGSVTVIGADMLAKYNITSVPEALRLVPGMAVSQQSGGDYTINYHGSNSISPRRMNVLVDGMSVYRSAFAQVDWTMLPVAMDDIERIEVTRGPNSASYGPNSMLAIINIVTKHPNESAGSSLSGTTGSRGSRDAAARHGGKLGSKTNYWITLDHRQSDGFEDVKGSGFTLPGLDPHHDHSSRDLFNFRSSTDLGKNQNLEVRVSALNGSQEYQLIDQYQRTYPDARLQERDIGVTWRSNFSPDHEVKVNAYLSRHRNDQTWSECLPALAYLPELGALWRANHSYVLAILAGRTPSGGTQADNLLAAAALRAIRGLGAKAVAPACGTTDQNYIENRADIELQNTTVISDTLRFVAGIGSRRDTAESATYLQGKVSNNAWRVFANGEYRLDPTTIINAGGYYESDNLTGSSFSPRIAVNKHLNANNTVRLVLSRANRMPGIIEQRANWSYLVKGLNPALLGVSEAYFAESAQAKTKLEAEKNTSREIGYAGNFPALGLMVDAKLFDDSLTNLISERLVLGDFNPTNSNSLKLRGAELQVDYAPAPTWNLHTGYTHLVASSTTPMELSQYSKNGGMIALSHVFPGDMRVSLAAYKNQSSPTGQTAFGKQDLTVSTRFRLAGAVLTPSLTVTHLDETEVRYFYDIGRSITNRIGNQMQYKASMKVTF